nr:DNA-directed DNA polymerase [Tanacetum cinerariifolium]
MSFDLDFEQSLQSRVRSCLSFITQQLLQRSNEDIKLEMVKLIKNNRILLNDNIFPHEETNMEVLLAKERILKLLQAWDEKQSESWSLPELLPRLLNDSQTINEMLKQHEQTANLAVQKDRFSEIKYAFTDKQYQPEEIQELMCKLLEDVRNIREELAEYINSVSWNSPTFYDDDEEHSIQYKEYLENSSNAIAPVLPTEEPEYSLSMGDEDAFEDIEYVEASLLDSELVSLEEENYVYQEEKEFDLEDILQIQDVILHEKLLSINCLIADIESLNDNPSLNRVFKSSFSFPNFEKSNNFLSYSDNSLPEFKTLSDHTKETKSGSTTSHANYSLLEYDLFCFKTEPDLGRRSNRRRVPNIVEPEIHTIKEVVPMADHTMEELLQAPKEGYRDAIVISKILAENFEIKTNCFTVEKTCVIYGGAHAYYDCIATDSDQPSACAATGTYNQVSPPNRASNQIPPPGFAPVQNNPKRYNQNQGQGNNINRGNNFQNNQGYRAPMNNASNFQNQGFQNQPFQVPNNQIQPSIPNELLSYMKSNEMLFRNMQNQINVLRGDFNKQEENLRRNLNNDMRSILGSFFQNQASTSGTLPSNIVSNPKGEMKAVTTRSGLAYEGPSIPTNSALVKVVERDTEEMTDKEHSNYALLLIPKFASTIKSLLTNKDKLFELAKVPLNENCSAMLLKKLPEKLGDPGKFLIPCDFPGIDVCHALADLGASINLMPLSIWKKLSLPELTPTRMTLELADRSITHPKGVAEDVFVKVEKFHFPTDFVVVDFEADPRVPLILGISFLRTGRALIDVYGEEITLRVNDESITFNLNQTMRYSSTYDDNSVNRVDVIDIACGEFVQDVLDFQYNSKSSNPTLVSNPSISENNSCKKPIVKSSSPTLTLFGEKKTKAKSSIKEPPELELKELLSHLEYAFLEESDKLPVIITKDLKYVEKEALIKVLKSHKQAIAWKIFDTKGIDPRFCTQKILMEEDYKPTVQSQRRVIPKIHDVIKKEVIKLLDADMIYQISDSPWVSPIHCVPKKGGMTVVANKNNELIPTRLVTGSRVCIDYKKLNDATRKDHFSLPFMDQMLERLAENEYYCFLDGF